MPLFSVIIPTYNHCDPIIWAIKSVQEQTLQDFEIIVAGDGVPDRTREIMAELCSEDSRIRFLDNPKGENKGELHRHSAVLAAKGTYIAYLSDDDLWHRSHLEVLSAGLHDADFCNTLHGYVLPDGELKIFPGTLATQVCRYALTNLQTNFFGTTCVGHRREAYIQLPHGWQIAPKGLWCDLHMWRQWIAAPDTRFNTVPQLTTVHLDSPVRGDMTLEDRAEESRKWLEKVRDDKVFRGIEDKALRDVALGYGGYRALTLHFQDTIKQLNQTIVSLKAERDAALTKHEK